jgi:hypothetical protein
MDHIEPKVSPNTAMFCFEESLLTPQLTFVVALLFVG